MPARYLVVNADDFGASTGINSGVIEAHTRGIVTSASVMVTGRAVPDAVSMARDHPDLALGLHWDVWGEDEREFDLDDVATVREEFRRQVDRFEYLFKRMPTHVDSHKHAHFSDDLMSVFRDLVEPIGVPLRGDGQVRFVGGFYAQWEWMVTNLEYVSVPFLQKLLSEEVVEGWTELSCHPGYQSPDHFSVYSHEREAELRTLTDPRIKVTIDELGVSLVSYSDWPALSAQP